MSWLDDFYRIIRKTDMKPVKDGSVCPHCDGRVILAHGHTRVTNQDTYLYRCVNGHNLTRWHYTIRGAWKELNQ